MAIDSSQFRIDRFSRPDVAAQIVADIVREKAEAAAEQRRAAAPPRRRSRGLLLGVLAALFFGLSGWNLLRSETPEPFTPEQQEASLRVHVFLTTQALEAYRDSAGVYPPTLAAIDMDAPGLAYVPSESSYALVAAAGPVRLTYRRGDDLARFAAAVGVLSGEANP